jgi:thymidylate synthase
MRNNIENQYLKLLKDILENGVEKKDRTGTGTISVFGRQIRHKMSDGFPLLTTKKMYFRGIVTELLWFLQGRTDLRYLLENECHIWNGDAYTAYKTKIQSDCSTDNPKYKDGFDCNYLPVTGTVLEDVGSKYSLYAEPFRIDEFIGKIKTDDEFAKKWGDLGPIYGYQWRSFSGFEKITKGWHHGAIAHTEDKSKYDQIAVLINDLKTNPDSRRLMVTAWNPLDLDKQVLPPCHYGFQVYTRELSLEERYEIRCKRGNFRNDWGQFYSTFGGYSDEMDSLKKSLSDDNIPTRTISLMFNMRSCDVPLGLPFNIASYGLLLEIIGKMVNMVPDELIASLGDSHIYKNQVDGIKEQLTREPYQLPTLIISDEVDFTGTIDDALKSYNKDSFKLVGYESHPSIKIPLSN